IDVRQQNPDSILVLSNAPLPLAAEKIRADPQLSIRQMLHRRILENSFSRLLGCSGLNCLRDGRFSKAHLGVEPLLDTFLQEPIRMPPPRLGGADISGRGGRENIAEVNRQARK